MFCLYLYLFLASMDVNLYKARLKDLKELLNKARQRRNEEKISRVSFLSWQAIKAKQKK